MRSRGSVILNIVMLIVIAIGYQSCDSTLTIEKPSTFIKYIGMDGDQVAVDMVTDASGSVYILGSTALQSSVNKNVYVVKTSPEGDLIWSKTYGGEGDETPKDLEILSNGNLVMIADRFENGIHGYVISILSVTDGNLVVPERTISTLGVAEYANSVTQTDDGFIVAGYTDEGSFNQGRIRRFDSDLAEYSEAMWGTRLDQLSSLSGYDVTPIKVFQFSQDVFYTFGYSNTPLEGRNDNSDYNFFIYVSTSDNGVLNILYPEGPEPNSDERLTEVWPISAANQGGFVLAGYVSTGGSQALYMMRVVNELQFAQPDPDDPNPTYVLVKGRAITDRLSNVSSNTAAVYPSQSSLLVLGESTTENENNTQMYLTKFPYSFGGNVPGIWSRTFGGIGNDVPASVLELADGSILVCGTMVLGDVLGQTKIVLMKLDNDGMLGD